MNRPDLAKDPRFFVLGLAQEERAPLRQIVGEWVTSRFASVEEALAVLTEARIPCAPVLRPIS